MITIEHTALCARLKAAHESHQKVNALQGSKRDKSIFSEALDALQAVTAERDALKAIADSDDGAGGEGMKLYLENRALKADAGRLDWVGDNRSANHDSDVSGHYVVSWVPQNALGNKNGASGQFLAQAPSFRECIDKFLSGDIVRID